MWRKFGARRSRCPAHRPGVRSDARGQGVLERFESATTHIFIFRTIPSLVTKNSYIDPLLWGEGLVISSRCGQHLIPFKDGVLEMITEEVAKKQLETLHQEGSVLAEEFGAEQQRRRKIYGKREPQNTVRVVIQNFSEEKRRRKSRSRLRNPCRSMRATSRNAIRVGTAVPCRS